MDFKTLNSHKELLSEIEGKDKAFVLLYKKGSELSECALNNSKKAFANNPKLNVYTVDVKQVRDIHPAYNVSSAPTMLVFENGKFKKLVKGCHDENYFNAVFNNIIVKLNEKGEKVQPSVTMYSTPTCTYCHSLKAYYRKHNIKFREIDVSKDQKAAQDMVNRSGQQGVPQSLIGGQVVVGFDTTKINQLLGIQG
jgi:glutaredoxin-like YruB-family protein